MDDDARRLLDWVDDRVEPARHGQVEHWLTEHAWAPCGEGDWARAYRCPCGRLAARVSPFDPASEFTVRLYREGAGSPYLPRLDAHRALDGGGCLTVMEFLAAVELDEARRWYRRLHEATADGDADLAAASELIDRVHREAKAELPWCGPLDDNPGNVMRKASGQIAFVDPFYVRGLVLYDKALRAPQEVTARIPRELRRHLLEIPAVLRESTPDEIERMRVGLAAADRVSGAGSAAPDRLSAEERAAAPGAASHDRPGRPR